VGFVREKLLREKGILRSGVKKKGFDKGSLNGSLEIIC
jgi:hypothetical protein